MKKVLFFLSLLLAFSLPFFVSAGTPGHSDLRPAIDAELPPPCALPAPATVNVNNITSFSAGTSWTPVSGAAWYKVRLENVSNPATPNVIQYIQAPNTSANLSGLTQSTSYIVHVSATACGAKDTYGGEQNRGFETPAIIIDDALLLERCNNYDHEITIPPTTGVVNLSLLAIPPSNPPTGYNRYLITSGTEAVEFAVWNVDNNGSYQPYYSQIRIGGITRTPQSDGTTTDISLAHGSNNQELCHITALSSGADFAPYLHFVFYNNGGEVPHLYGCFKNNGGSGGGFSGSDNAEVPTKLLATPNPLTDQTTLHYTVGKDTPLTLSLYNSTGTLVKTVLNKVWTAAGYQETTVEMSDLPNGLYFVTLETNEGRQVSTLVKTN